MIPYRSTLAPTEPLRVGARVAAWDPCERRWRRGTLAAVIAPVPPDTAEGAHVHGGRVARVGQGVTSDLTIEHTFGWLGCTHGLPEGQLYARLDAIDLARAPAGTAVLVDGWWRSGVHHACYVRREADVVGEARKERPRGTLALALVGLVPVLAWFALWAGLAWTGGRWPW